MAVKRIADIPAIAAAAHAAGAVLMVDNTFTTHRWLSPQERHKIGIGEGFVRISVGIEAVEDIIADLAQALDMTEL